jgi:glycosyltransferase involved in cell wall biosynthesis
MRRLAYVANSQVPSRQANTVHVLNMCAAFEEARTEVSLLARGDPRQAGRVFEDFSLPARFELCLLPSRRPWALDRWMFVRHVRRSLRAGGFDFVYGRSAYGLLAGVPSHIPFAYDVHAWPAMRRHEGLEARLFRRQNLLFVTAISKALVEAYSAAYPHLRKRIVLAPCATQLPDRPEPAVRTRHEPLRIYYVGHLYPGRGIDLILEVARLEPGFEFHIVGGEERDIDFWRAKATENVVFHGYIPPADLPRHYRLADVCIAPHGRHVSAAGGGNIANWMSPMKIFEYMAYAKPIVAADLPAVREILTNGIDSILCPPGDVEAWQAALRTLHRDVGARERLGEAARSRVASRHTWEQRARLILDEASRLLALRTIGE